jgi:Fic-DOC domain mobile mystery protein B
VIESQAPGSTPLDPDESHGLIPAYVTNHDDLNRAEQANILEALNWATSRKHSDLISDSFIRKLHQKMFGNVWRWAGFYRKTLKNIGVPPEIVAVEIRKLCDDAKYQVGFANLDWDDFGVRFHHRLVWIHPFPNGNGRHARLMTDLILRAHARDAFSWGAESTNGAIGEFGKTREKYLSALRSADAGDWVPLRTFVRS